tara:strand:- start:2178 stop:3962 length:1785 start_codon:yes stop_codon:yes gene_type:complete
MINENKLKNIFLEFKTKNKLGAYNKLKKIFKSNKSNKQLRYNLAVMEQELNLYTDAEKNYKYLIQNNFDFRAKVNLYNIYLNKNLLNDALNLIDEILEEKNDLDYVYQDKINTLYKLKNYKNVIIESNKLIIDKKENVHILNALGWSYFYLDEVEKAENILLTCLDRNSENIKILNSLGRFYHEKRDSKNAKKYFVKAFNINKNILETLNNYAGFCLEESEYIKAIELYKSAEKIDSNNSILLNNLSKAYFSLRDFIQADKYVDRALNLDKNNNDIKKNKSIILLKNYNFNEAWKYFDSRLGLSDFKNKNKTLDLIKNKIPETDKIKSNSKILIIREQGVGDEILYGTMYNDFLSLFPNTVFECDDRLISLFRKSFSADHRNKFFKLGEFSNKKENLKNFDYVLYAGSLGKFVRKKIHDFTKKPYLKKNDNIKNSEIKKIFEMKNITKIGISWKSFKNRYSREKSLELEDLKTLFKKPNCIFLNLQYGDIKKEVINFTNLTNNKIITIKDLDLFNDFEGLTDLLSSLDIFISVSNSTAHIAGALGVKTFLIKPENHAAYHYWNYDNGLTPWYSCIKIINKKDLFNKEFIKNKLN